MSRPSIRHLLCAALVFTTSQVRAQGSIGLQGYGYPPGQLTTRASSSGGGLGEFDQAAPINPAALLNWGVAGAYIQYSPERRSTTVAGVSNSSTVARFPVFSVGLPLGPRYAFGLSSSTLLERNYETTLSARQVIRSDSVTTTSLTTAKGSMNAVQFAGAMQVTSWLRVGTGLQLITGQNTVKSVRSIVADTVARADTVAYGTITESSTATFKGTALSFGVELAPTKKISIAASARLGFRLNADLSDTTTRRADVPNRAGAAIRWEVAGSNISARYDWQGWSALKGIGGTAGGLFNTKEVGVGAEVPGPKLPGGQMLIRIGVRNRGLPYGVAGQQPKENIIGGGLGLPIGFGRAQFDLGIEHASRTIPNISTVKESGWIASFGFRIRT